MSVIISLSSPSPPSAPKSRIGGRWREKVERSRIVMLRALAALSGLDVAAGLTNAGRVQYPYRHCTRSTSPGRRCRTENLELNSAGLALPGELRRCPAPPRTKSNRHAGTGLPVPRLPLSATVQWSKANRMLNFLTFSTNVCCASTVPRCLPCPSLGSAGLSPYERVRRRNVKEEVPHGITRSSEKANRLTHLAQLPPQFCARFTSRFRTF